MTVTIDNATPKRISIDEFYCETADERAVHLDCIADADKLIHDLRGFGVYGASDLTPVVVLTDPSGDQAGGELGTVALPRDDKHLETIDRAIRALEAVRDGLRVAGHADD